MAEEHATAAATRDMGLPCPGLVHLRDIAILDGKRLTQHSVALVSDAPDCIVRGTLRPRRFQHSHFVVQGFMDVRKHPLHIARSHNSFRVHVAKLASDANLPVAWLELNAHPTHTGPAILSIFSSLPAQNSTGKSTPITDVYQEREPSIGV